MRDQIFPWETFENKTFWIKKVENRKQHKNNINKNSLDFISNCSHKKLTRGITNNNLKISIKILKFREYFNQRIKKKKCLKNQWNFPEKKS